MTVAAVVMREARADELDRVSAILDRAWSEYDRLGGDEPSWREYRESVTDVRSRLGDSMLIVAERDGALAGTVTYYPARRGETSGEEWPDGWASLRLLGVDPATRGEGLGKMLTEECIRRARAEGAPTLGLHTSDWMVVARDMYERMGFVRYPELDFRPRPNFVVTAYRLDLRPAQPGAPR